MIDALRRKRIIADGYSRIFYKFSPVLKTPKDTIARYESVIIDSQLWMSSVADFNDPFDSSVKIHTLASVAQKKAYLKSIFKSSTPPPGNKKLSFSKRNEKISELMATGKFNEIFQNSYNSAINKAGICCLSRKPRGSKNILMWSHYSSGHKGICFVFDVSKGFSTFKKALPVTYKRKFPIVDNILCEPDQLIKNGVLNKAEDWEYENEARIFVNNAAKTNIKFPPAALIGIILGVNISSETKNIVLACLSKRKSYGMTDVAVYEARRHESRYEIQVFKIKSQ